ncbi:MAG: hypothetical protein IJ899_03185 [Blautia sp.]|nr:hypothetical protein [Blautia sp.]
MFSKIFKKTFKKTEQKPRPNCFVLEGGDALHEEIAFVTGPSEKTIPFLKKHGIQYMDDVESLSNKKSPRVHVVLCKISKEDTENWRAALDEIWENPPTEDYRDICGQLDQIFTEEARKKHE